VNFIHEKEKQASPQSDSTYDLLANSCNLFVTSEFRVVAQGCRRLLACWDLVSNQVTQLLNLLANQKNIN